MTYHRQLPNGIRVVGEEIPTLRSVSIGVWVKTGSRYETEQENGVSHFLEHMFFKGTDRYSAKELAQVFDELGGQVNAFTSKEYTCFYSRVLDEHFTVALDTLANMLLSSTFADDELEKEKRVVIEEIHMYEDTPDELVMDLLAEGTYRGHPLGYTILGTESNLQSFSSGDLRKYVSEQYNPHNIVIAVAGHVDEDTAVREVERLFGGMSGGAQANRSIQAPPFHRSMVTRHKDIEQVHLCLSTLGLPAGTAQMYPLILLNNILGGTQSSRLFQEIREDAGMAYSVFSFHTAYQDAGMFGIYAGTSPDHVESVVESIQRICKTFAEVPLSTSDLEKTKQQVKGAMMLGLESSGSRMSRIAKNELLLNREVPVEETLAGIEAVTVAQVKEMADRLFKDGFALSAVGPIADIDFAKLVPEATA
ncbi:M16 family metallopeptidase [Alicyclobacillus fastidiosus]|uniref:Pitrilysin family protein n=1 Tax=Alicyclobacillus fastidiosus TaxID=392011 RepID=A0ABV5AIH0_9BACL|nr:pitrilysin family protein [Alicyclobacillus fastidiosus]WEH07883.1 pitrilysin family protein [Alicyclobacillus fastidiosus]